MSAIEKTDEFNLMLDSVKETFNNINKEHEKILNFINGKIKSNLEDIDKIKESFKEINAYITQYYKNDDEKYKCFSFIDICCAIKIKSYLCDLQLQQHKIKYEKLIDYIKSNGLGLISYCEGYDGVIYTPLCINLNYLLNKNKSFTIKIFKDKGYNVGTYDDNNFIIGPNTFKRFFKDFCKDEITEEQLNNYLLLSFIDVSYPLYIKKERRKNIDKLFEEILLYV